MKIWLDDVREPPDDSWTWEETAKGAIALLHYPVEPVTVISLDHDLGLWETGLAVAEYIADHTDCVDVVRIHSMNPVGAARMRQILESAGKKVEP